LFPEGWRRIFFFGDTVQRDPFLWAFVRPNQDFGHEIIFKAIRKAWFDTEADGVLSIDLSAETYHVTSQQLEPILNETKEQIRKQLEKCPESIILLRQSQQHTPLSIIDFLHDVSQMSTDLKSNVDGSKAIYILEVVVKEEKSALGQLLHESQVKHQKTIHFLRHSQKIRESILREYFGQWRAIGTRLWVTWEIELTQKTKLKMYRRKFHAIKNRLQYENNLHINFPEENEEEHCNNLSPPQQGIMAMLEFLSEDHIKSVVLKTCPENEQWLSWSVNGTLVKCDHLKSS